MSNRELILALVGCGDSDTDKVPAAIAIITADPNALSAARLHSFMANCVGPAKWDCGVDVLLSA